MSKVYIIAEAGVNHNGDLKKAKKLVQEAKKAGADAVKFQYYKTENLVLKKTPKTKYQKKNEKKFKNQFDMLKKYELSKYHLVLLQRIAQKLKIDFFVSVFNHENFKEIKKLNFPYIKIPSGEINNVPLLKYIGKANKKTILSTGMSQMKEVKKAVNLLEKNGLKRNKLTVLHCNSAYPTPIDNVNLNAITSIKNELKLRVGYSDHTETELTSLAAVSLGAKVIEKHLTLNKKLDGPDHKSSFNSNEFKKLVDKIRLTEKILGSGLKFVSSSEAENKKYVRKSIVAKKSIRKGEIFSEKNLTLLRPAGGKNPYLWDKLIGTKSRRNYNEFEKI